MGRRCQHARTDSFFGRFETIALLFHPSCTHEGTHSMRGFNNLTRVCSNSNRQETPGGVK